MEIRVKRVFLILSLLLILLVVGCENLNKTSGNKEVDSIYTESENSQTHLENKEEILNNIGNELANKFDAIIGNLVNGGLVAENDNWIYYCNTNDDWKLYKTKKDGTEKIKLTAYPVISINVVGECIYFRDYVWGETACIAKINTDGSSEKVIIEEPTHNVIVVDDWIYYVNINDNLIYRVKTDGSNNEVLVDTKVDRFFIQNDNIIYNDLQDDMIYKKSLDSQDKEILVQKKVAFFIVSEGSVYYSTSDGETLYKKEIEGEIETMLLSGIPIQSFNVKDDWIYYSVGTDTVEYDLQGLYKVKTDGKSNAKLSDDRVRDINIIDDWIYFINRSDGQNLYRVKTDGTQKQKVE
jgi:hypothetical protein